MNKLLAAIYILASVADYSITVWGIVLTSFEMEANGIAQEILINHGFVGLSIYKFGGVLFVLAVMVKLASTNWNRPWIRHTVPILLLLGIVVSLIGVWSWLPVLSM